MNIFKRFSEPTPRNRVIIGFILIVSGLLIQGVDIWDSEKVGEVLKSFQAILLFLGSIQFGATNKG